MSQRTRLSYLPAGIDLSGGIGEEIGRNATSTAAPLRFFPADVAEQAEQTDAHASSQRSCHNCGVAIVTSPAELATRA